MVRLVVRNDEESGARAKEVGGVLGREVQMRTEFPHVPRL